MESTKMKAVREKITNKLSDVSKIADGIYRGVRKQGTKDIASYVFDINSKLPRTAGHLSVYLDEVLGQSYFSESAAADLRWNSYLYFVVNQEEARAPSFGAIKKALEADRSYARKYVVLEDDFEQILSELDSVAVPHGTSQAIDVLQVWSEKLSPVGLSDVLDENRTVSDIVREISTGSAKNTMRSRKVSGLQESKKLVSSKLESIDLGNFRPYPKQSKFDKLGRANLIFGANGAGKTSFMEGLEFLFCGENRRSMAHSLASVSGRLESGVPVSTSGVQPLSDFKTRQRLWYGSDDSSRNNNLPNQFSRFNFLNTDAAAELSLLKDTSKGGQKNNSETLADLLSGHEATEVWKRVQSLHKAVIGEGREKRSALDKAKAEKEVYAEKLKKLEEAPGQVAAAFSIFVKNLHNVSWKEIPLDAQSIGAGLEDRLVELGAQLTVIRQLGWMGEDITEALILEKVAAFSIATPALKEELSQIRASERTAKSLADRKKLAILRRDELAAIAYDAVKDLIQLEKNLKAAKDELSRNAKTFSAVFVDFPPEGWESSCGALSVNWALEQCVAAEKRMRDELSGHEKDLAALTSTHTQLQNAIAQVHDWARKVIEHRHSDESCPVCNTVFQPGELLGRMSEQLSAPAELALTDLKSVIDKLSREILETIGVRKWLSALHNFASTIPGGTLLTVLEAQPLAVNAHGRFMDLLVIQRQSQNRLDDYARTGLSLQTVENLCLPLDGVELTDIEHFDIETAKVRVEMYLQELENKKSEIEKKVALHNAAVSRLLPVLALGKHQSISAAEEIAETRLDQLQRAAAACSALRLHLDLHSMTNLIVLCGSIEASVLSAKNIISLIGQQATAGTEQSFIKGKLDDLASQIVGFEESIKRLLDAFAVLKDIIDNHSLDAATAAVVEATHTVADSIFSRIHTPAEYRVNSIPESPLVRRDTGAGVQLNEVSTGQRAAYALSMFLAMNAQVKDGPKVMLLDDPISYIDDLNALSFLDYLRNVVLKSDRQLFFATADERIAGLFAHKFGFLEDDFRIIELSRG